MFKLREVLFLYKKNILLIFIFGLVCIILFGGIYIFKTEKTRSDYIEFNSNNESIEIEEDETLKVKVDELIKVDVKGEVKKPGVYQLTINSRINDVIELAGGFTSKADSSVLNLSKRLVDEMVIIVYSLDEVKNFSKTKTIQENENIKCKNTDKLENNACIVNQQTSSIIQNGAKININTATIDVLMGLTGIGESKANAIIEYRNNFGKFKKIEDIMNVNGIGQALFDKVKEDITIQ